MKLRMPFVCAVCILLILFCLSGCNKDKYVLDKTGMVNPFVWESFSVSRSDSYAQHNFYIEVALNETGEYIVTGSLRDADGTEYEEEEGIVLPESACIEIDALKPEHLADLDSGEAVDLSEEELLMLDAPTVSVQVEYVNGERVAKRDEDSFSVRLYEIVLPYFRDKFK